MGKITPPPIIFEVKVIPEFCKLCGAPLKNNTCISCRIVYKKIGEKPHAHKFPIDYEPGKVQGFLISKETGQMIEATPLTEITPKPWPIDDIEIETEPEPPKSLTLSCTFTLKKKMKANQRRKLIRALSGKQKLPRKLKKALKKQSTISRPGCKLAPQLIKYKKHERNTKTNQAPVSQRGADKET